MVLASRIAQKRGVATISQIKLKIYKEVPREACANFDGAEKFIHNKIQQKCFRETSFEVVTYFIYEVLCF